MPHPVSERVKRYRTTRKADRGIVRVEVAIHADDARELRAYALRLKQRRTRMAEFDELRQLLDQAFKDFGVKCFDNMNRIKDDAPLHSLLIHANEVANRLMVFGGQQGFVLGRKIQGLSKELTC